jgi:hypothetical protein
MTTYYSGNKSKGFWGRIKKLQEHDKWYRLYSLGVKLQNLEGKVLKELAEAEKRAKGK